jgi:RimJ/RimL family protein N-acetyltransferase
MNSPAAERAVIAPELHDESLLLRPWSAIDPAQLREAVQESMLTVGRWQPWCRPDYGFEEANAWIECCRQGWLTGADYSLAICDASSGELIGGIGLNHINHLHRSANLGYWVRQRRQGHGVAARASALLTRFGFETLGLIRIEIVAEPDNLPSRRVAEKLGARLEAIARQRLWIHDQPKDAAVYALVPGDLKSRPA